MIKYVLMAILGFDPIRWREPLLDIVLAEMASRPHDFAVEHDGIFYLKRWFRIVRNWFFNIYFHEIVGDDNDQAEHDHPYLFNFSLLVRGPYIEIIKNAEHIRLEGSVIWRGPFSSHRLVVSRVPEGIKKDATTITIFICGPRVRRWGFHCPKGWVHYKKFVGTNYGGRAIGCGEMS